MSFAFFRSSFSAFNRRISSSSAVLGLLALQASTWAWITHRRREYVNQGQDDLGNLSQTRLMVLRVTGPHGVCS